MSCHHSIGNKVSFGGLTAHCPGVITVAGQHHREGEAAHGFNYTELTVRKEKKEKIELWGAKRSVMLLEKRILVKTCLQECRCACSIRTQNMYMDAKILFRHKCSDTNVQTQKERHLHCRTFMYANAKASVKWRRWDSNP